ncbi:MAG TPA: hypothetical protein VFQ42_22105 [Mycobacterium sp.]|nr:hypothetical protein [Mycobacterium sp.]
MNLVTCIEYDLPLDDQSVWHRCEIERQPVRRVRYETDYDLTAILGNLSVVGALAAARQLVPVPALPDDAHPLLHWYARRAEEMEAAILRAIESRAALISDLKAKIVEWGQRPRGDA